MVDISQLTWVTMVSDDSTPPEALVYNGRVVGLPSEYATALGSGPGSPGRLYGVPGYLRAGTAGPEWLMTPIVPLSVLGLIRDLPATHGWTDSGARSAYVSAARHMLLEVAAGGLGLSTQDVGQILTVLHNQAVKNWTGALPA